MSNSNSSEVEYDQLYQRDNAWFFGFLTGLGVCIGLMVLIFMLDMVVITPVSEWLANQSSASIAAEAIPPIRHVDEWGGEYFDSVVCESAVAMEAQQHFLLYTSPQGYWETRVFRDAEGVCRPYEGEQTF